MKEGEVICTKKCYDSAYAAYKSTLIQWHNDNSSPDSKSSLQLLLEWLLAPGNYANKWRGKKNDGKKKAQVAEMLANMMNDAGVKVKRTKHSVKSKIRNMETQFKTANDFVCSETGAGVEEKDGKEAFQTIVLRKCPYYYELAEIMGDRAAAKPKATTDDDDLDSVDDEEIVEVINSQESSEEEEEDDADANADDEEEKDEETEEGAKKPAAVNTPAKRKRATAINSSAKKAPKREYVSSTAAATIAAAELASTKNRIAMLKEKEMTAEEELKQADRKIAKMEKVKAVREKFGYSNKQIKRMFPTLASTVDEMAAMSESSSDEQEEE